MNKGNFTAVAKIDEIPLNTSKAIAIGGRAILLCNSDGQFYAIENQCSHAQEPLECGRLRLGWIACPAHGARFDLETGEPLTMPATEPIQTFAVRISGDTIEVAADRP